MEVACALDHLVLEREKEKWGKYQGTGSRPGETMARFYGSGSIPVVFGDLGRIGKMNSHLHKAGLLRDKARETVIRP